MKKVALVLILLVGVTAIAQKNPQKEKKERHQMQEFTPEQVATLKTKKMTLALDLTAVQQEKVKALQLENATLRKTNMESKKAQREAGESKKPTSEERFAMVNARLDHQIAQKTEMKNILSVDQFARWEKLHAQKGKRAREKKEGDHNRHKERN